MLIKKVIQNVSDHLMQPSIERWEAPFMHIKTRIYTEYYYVCKWFGKIYELIREDIRSHWKLLIPRWHWIQVFDWDTEVKLQSFIVFIRSWYLSNLKTQVIIQLRNFLVSIQATQNLDVCYGSGWKEIKSQYIELASINLRITLIMILMTPQTQV